jgi:hypothetical protein
MSSSDIELNVRPNAVRVVKEGLNSEYIIILTSNSEIMELTITKHIPGLFSKVEQNVFRTVDQPLWFCLLCNFAEIYEMTKVKLFDIYSCQPDRLYFPCYDYDYLLVDIN